MKQLKHTKVSRKGETQSDGAFKKGDTDGVRLTTSSRGRRRRSIRDVLGLNFNASSSGGGGSSKAAATDFRVEIEPQDYAAIIEGMYYVEPETTLANISSILHSHFEGIKRERDENPEQGSVKAPKLNLE